MHNANDVFSALLFSGQSGANAQFFQQQIQQLSMMPVHDQIQQQWIQQAQATYEHSYGDEAIRRQREILRDYGVDSSAQYNAIVEILDLQLLQQASPVMQDWLMCSPDLDLLYTQQRIDGYSATYVRNAHAVKDRAAAVLDGVVDEEGSHTTTYCDYLDDAGNHLNLYQKNDIMLSWEAALMYIGMGHDPTNVTGESL